MLLLISGQSFSGSTNSYRGPGEPDISSNNGWFEPQPAILLPEEAYEPFNPEFNYGFDPTSPYTGDTPVYEPGINSEPNYDPTSPYAGVSPAYEPVIDEPDNDPTSPYSEDAPVYEPFNTEPNYVEK